MKLTQEQIDKVRETNKLVMNIGVTQHQLYCKLLKELKLDPEESANIKALDFLFDAVYNSTDSEEFERNVTAFQNN
jgi:hypothetical protein